MKNDVVGFFLFDCSLLHPHNIYSPATSIPQTTSTLQLLPSIANNCVHAPRSYVILINSPRLPVSVKNAYQVKTNVIFILEI